MIASYWVTRKKNLDLQRLYTYGPQGYWLSGGWGKAAFLSMILTWIVCYIISIGSNIAVGLEPLSAATGSFIAYIGPIPFPGSITWYAATVVSFLFMVWLQKAFKENV
jgi:cytosine/uracil/thiamine/allantoin permease